MPAEWPTLGPRHSAGARNGPTPHPSISRHPSASRAAVCNESSGTSELYLCELPEMHGSGRGAVAMIKQRNVGHHVLSMF